MFNKDSVLKFSQDILKRYEANIQGGTFFLYNYVNKEFWSGNNSSYAILKLIDGVSNIEHIYSYSCSLFKNYGIDAVKNSVDAILSELIEKKMIILANEEM